MDQWTSILLNFKMNKQTQDSKMDISDKNFKKLLK